MIAPLRIDTIMRMERTHEEIRRAMLETETVVAGQLQIIDMGDYGDYGVPNLNSRLFSSLKLAAEISQITDANYPDTRHAKRSLSSRNFMHGSFCMAYVELFDCRREALAGKVGMTAVFHLVQETVRKAFIIRLGSCTSTAWRYCIQPLLPERTQHKLVPCGPKVTG